MASQDESPLVAALRTGHDEQFQALLRSGADPNEADSLGHTPLHHAALFGDGPAVLALLEAGAEPNARDVQGHTFQTYLWMTPDAFFRGDERVARFEIRRWLRRHGIPAEDRDSA